MLLDLKLPRPLTALHQIEVSSRCNLRCDWCVHPTMSRPKVDMREEDFEAALDWVRYFVRRGTQSDLNLAGIGESTLHPQFVDFIYRARAVVGSSVKLIFATNGIEFNKELIDAVQRCSVNVWVSLHQPRRAMAAVTAYRDAGVLEDVSTDPITLPSAWAGQVDWPIAKVRPLLCHWIRYGRAMVCADGSITRCCLDASGQGVLAHVSVGARDRALAIVPYKLCRSCHQKIDIVGYNQETGHYEGA